MTSEPAVPQEELAPAQEPLPFPWLPTIFTIVSALAIWTLVSWAGAYLSFYIKYFQIAPSSRVAAVAIWEAIRNPWSTYGLASRNVGQLAAIVYMFERFKRLAGPIRLGLVWPGRRDILPFTLAQCALWAIGFAAGPYLRLIGQEHHESAFTKSWSSFEITSALQVALLVCSTAVSPLYEELQMRGILFNATRFHFGFGAALVISSSAFALLHIDLILFPYFFATGVVLAVLYVRTKNFLVTWAAHAFFDGSLFLIQGLRLMHGHSR